MWFRGLLKGVPAFRLDSMLQEGRAIMEADLGSGFWVRAFATSLLWVLSSVGAEGPFAEGVYARPYRASIETKLAAQRPQQQKPAPPSMQQQTPPTKKQTRVARILGVRIRDTIKITTIRIIIRIYYNIL